MRRLVAGQAAHMHPARIPTLRGRLVLLVAIVALALLALAAVTVWQVYERISEQAEAQLRSQAIALAHSIDREFERADLALSILSTSAALGRNIDLDVLEAQLRATSALLGGQPITLAAADGREVLSTLWAPGERRQSGPKLSLMRRPSRGYTEISDLYRSPNSGHLVIDISVPVLLERQVPPAYSLYLSLRRDNFTQILAEQLASQGWDGAVVDRLGHIVADSRRDEEAVGQPVPSRLRTALETTDSGVLIGELRLPEGMPAVTAFAHAPISGYAVLVSMSEETFLAPLRAALWRILGTGAAIAAVGTLLAMLLGRRIVASLHVLEMLGQGDEGLSASVPTAGLREVDDAARVLSGFVRQRSLLVSELNHRVKNTLATVQSVAAQTLRSTGDDSSRFMHDFSQRLQALAAAHDLLTAHSWNRVDIAAIIEAALRPWRGDAGSATRITSEGPGGISVTPRQAQAVVLALHELATNALKYGALTRAAGRVALTWSQGPDRVVLIHWTETGGPEIERPPERRGFGTRMLERGLTHDLGPGSSVLLRFEHSGACAVIRFTPAVED
jgi:two-component sensor histidine kinase